MDSERYQKVCQLFAEADELPPESRAAFLDDNCGDDAELRSEVESLLASDAESGDFIEQPALEIAADQLADENAAKVGLEIAQYKIVSMLGAGGMGEVWLAEDTRLKRRVALKLLSAVHKKDLLARFEQEAFAVSALNHPNILTIFDIGQNDGWQFIATEFINGKTLRQLLREKSLTVYQTIEIAEQICAALAAAHSAGIVHRDIKPENIMIRADRIVKILDFGLARFSDKPATDANAKFITKPGMILGTVAYMSPEQARALPVDEKTDVFSLGIVVYEMLAGKTPFDGVNEIEMLAAILEREPPPLDANVPTALQKIVFRALIKSPWERISSDEMLNELRAVKRGLEFSSEIAGQNTTFDLQNQETVAMDALTADNAARGTGKINFSAAKKSQSNRNLIAAVLILLLISVSFAAVYAVYLKQKTPAILSEADKILLAEFENKTGDEELDGILRQPLAVGLAQSPFINLVSDGQVRQTLKLMEKKPDEPLTFDIAREVAQRRGIKVFVKGTIENYGVKYRITLEAFDTATGNPVVSEEAESANKDTILDSLDEATGDLRENLGESLASIKRFDQPLKTTTTASLEALKLYSQATKVLSVNGNIEEGITLLKQATEIDPNYASAYGSLAAAYSNRGQMSVAADYAAKAFALRDRMTEREKQKITSFYYVFVTGEIDKDIENLEAAKQIFPRDNTIPVNLGADYSELGKFAKAEENARQAINIDPTIFFPYSNLGRYLSRQSRFEESKAVFLDALDRKFESDQITSGLLTAAYALGDEAEIERLLKNLEEKDKAQALKFQGGAAVFAGKTREYEKFLNQAVAANEKEMPDVAADYASQTATNLAALDRCENAETWANRALKLDRGQQILIDATLVYAVCGKPTEPLIAELKQRFPKNIIVNSLWLPIIRAATEINESPERAIETLEINRQFEGATYFWDNFLRGRAFLKLKNGEQAAAEFQKILQNRGWQVNSPLYAMANLELARAFVLQNDAENARKYSEQFFAVWKNADADSPFLKSALADRGKIF